MRIIFDAAVACLLAVAFAAIYVNKEHSFITEKRVEILEQRLEYFNSKLAPIYRYNPKTRIVEKVKGSPCLK